jgi:hypothetical protein
MNNALLRCLLGLDNYRGENLLSTLLIAFLMGLGLASIVMGLRRKK